MFTELEGNVSLTSVGSTMKPWEQSLRRYAWRSQGSHHIWDSMTL